MIMPSSNGCSAPVGCENAAEADLRKLPVKAALDLVAVEPRPLLGQAADMDQFPPSLTFLLLMFSGWVNRHQQAVIDYLLEENCVLSAVTSDAVSL
jgi:hypothetical protein